MKTIQFRDFIILQRGFDLPKYNRDEGEYPVIAATGIQGFHSEFKVNPPGVVTGRSGSLGEVVFVERPYWPLNTTLWVKDFKGNKPRYVYYFLKTLDLKRFNSGAGVPTLNRNHLDTLVVKIHDSQNQHKIASILSAYDDLIGNNLRRIKILEEIAQSLYREWFVKFRFPGHQKVKMVDSPLGKIPEEWEVKHLSDVCSILMGQSPKSEFYNIDREGLPFHQGVTDFGERFPTTRVYCTFAGRIAEAGDILFSVRAPVGRLNLTDRKIIIGRGLSAIRNLDGYQCFTFHQLKEIFTEEDIMGGGTIFKAVTKGDMERIECLYPPKEHLVRFEKICLPIAEQLAALGKKNRILRRTRDLLLPKLISGELDVSELDIKTTDERL
jgi:type I restriction enzyme S subunit